jgi:uracil-DNA glycosylase
MRKRTEEDRFRGIFRALHAGHHSCAYDEWLREPCRATNGAHLRPVVWSRRNGPWRRVPLLFVGAAPGNAGGRGSGPLGAHGTRIPFGGDIAGANLEALLGSIGVSRNDVFIVAAYNQLPERGGGEPRPAEILAPAGSYRNSIAVLRDTLVACGSALVIALGNLAMRAVVPAVSGAVPVRLASITALHRAGFTRNRPARLDSAPVDVQFIEAWRAAWPGTALPWILWTTHPSAQNMSPFARSETAFYARMLETRAALRNAVRLRFGWSPPGRRPAIPQTGIYGLPEWRERIAPRLAEMDRLWRSKGV